MEILLTKENEIKKKAFTLNLKSVQKDGLVLRIHHTNENCQKLRFLHTCFNESGNLIASSDNNGNIFLINIPGCKFWGLPPVNSCSFLRFSSFRACEILVGLKSNEILIVNFELGLITGKLVGHSSVPNNITFSRCVNCLTSSETEAIIWDLQNNSKLKILALEGDSLLRYVAFIPCSNRILGCYMEGMINIWDSSTFQVLRILPASIWNNMDIRNIAFSSDGSIMVLSSTSPNLAVYSLKTWKIMKFVNLPEYIKSVRSLKFINLDNITKSVLAILSGDGFFSFFDIFENIIISELKAPHEIVRFDQVDQCVFISCVLCSGNIEIYDMTLYVEKPVKTTALTKKKLKLRLQQKTPPKKLEELKDELDDALNIEKLRSILKEYGEYPEAYRTMIWEQLLQLPYNNSVYDGIIKSKVQTTFKNLDREYPIENRSFKSLKSLLNNLVTWCGFFANVQYLPVFVYPFVKVFQNRPIVCFEAVATILLNWCQYWFEYFPLPPINILAIIENMFLELDPQLLSHIHEYGITSKQYAWPLLESAFSEVLTSQCWFVFWDHLLTNEPSFLLCAVVGYNIIQRNFLLNIKEPREFEIFYHKQNPLHIKRFIAKCYSIMEKTKWEIHPRKYLNMFKKLDKGVYPVFHGYPKVIIENETQKLNDLKKELHDIDLEEAKLILDKKRQIDKILDSDLENIEKKRLFEMKKACNERLQDQQIKAKQHLQRLTKLRKKFDDHQAKILKYSKSDLLRKRMIATDMLCSEIETNERTDEYQTEKAETLLLKHYSELMKHKMHIEVLLNEESSSIDEPRLHETIRREHRKILREIKKILHSPDAEMKIRQYNIVSSVLAMDDLIKKVESALAKELSSEYLDLNKSESCIRNLQLQTETEELEAEVSNLLNALSKSRIEESKSKLSTGYSTNTKSSLIYGKDKYQICASQSTDHDKTASCPMLSAKKNSASSISTQSYPSSVRITTKNVMESKKKVRRRKTVPTNKFVRFVNSRSKTTV
ncbi:hypothetical protein HHI36_001975 [Cryptolaemus montrouzieri]|uniref:TBC1 domain family member 31 n=1 Tax=Cryptolaemus montrouzieri TaxID=559131 RepID=A0ABD2P9D9_9CUCU